MRVPTRPLGSLILNAIQGKISRDTGLSYEQLYKTVCKNRRGTPSRRDFQEALNKLQSAGQLVLEGDPNDRRRRLIYQATTPKEGDSLHDWEYALASRLNQFLLDLFNNEPYLMPVKLWLEQGPPVEKDFGTLVKYYPWWQGLTVDQAKKVTTFGMDIWKKTLAKIGDKPAIQEAKQKELFRVMAEVNAAELAHAWRQRRAVDRSKIIRDLEQRLLPKPHQ
jgi:hypothetical protein